jgi:Protein of unknown function (DUF3467)
MRDGTKTAKAPAMLTERHDYSCSRDCCEGVFMNEHCGEPRYPDALEGRYANLFKIGHNAVEFVIDFGQFFPESEVQVHTRIITGPIYAKALLDTLRESIESYEQSFGMIPRDGRENRMHLEQGPPE